MDGGHVVGARSFGAETIGETYVSGEFPAGGAETRDQRVLVCDPRQDPGS